MKKIIFLYLILFFFPFTKGNAQCKLEKFTLVRTDNIVSENYMLIAENGITKKLNPNKYIVSLTFHENAYFAIFSIKGKKGWSAIDFNENILFEVYNTIPNEPWPDYLIEDRIRIVGKNNKIGFANECGKIIIKPKYDFATSFNNGYAIVGKKCSESSIKCNQYGYIDKNGKIIKISNYTFDQIQKEINWKDINL
ncbi:WG repeat-containing protein [uncultured Weeksella sp.]|uniref:WG repeat-containing protein n=1 Tax=uncultured Weeksella sp. TaxID=1161389 RepID=UPI00259BC158|nr:WG repeat-containing protein [uncultured Weeksella sp.]